MTSFSDFDIAQLYKDGMIYVGDLGTDDAVAEALINHIGELDLVEEFASDNNLIASEAELSERFDDENEEWLEKMNSQGDQVAIDTHFNDWSDGLCKDGLIHDKQYHEYCYVGKYAKDWTSLGD